MPPAERPLGEVHAADVDSDLHTAIGAVDRASTGVLETVDALTEPGHASRTHSVYRASTETGTKVMVPVMITMAGGPVVDRTSTEMHETTVLTPASVAEEPRGDPTMVETFTPRVGATASE